MPASFPTKKVALSLPTSAAAASFSVAPFMTVRTQCRSQWCWAAVAQSVAEYFQAASAPSQPELAYRVLTSRGLAIDLAECVRPPCSPAERGAADIPIDTLPLTMAGVRTISYRPNLTEDELQASLRDRRPVPMLINWADGHGSHAIAVVGGVTDATGVTRYIPGDPFDSTAPPHTFNALMSSYGSAAGGGGQVIHAWLVDR